MALTGAVGYLRRQDNPEYIVTFPSLIEKIMDEECSRLTDFFDVNSLFDVKGGTAHITTKERMNDFVEYLPIGSLRGYGPWSNNKKKSELSASTRSFFMFGINGCIKSHIENNLEVQEILLPYKLDSEWTNRRKERFNNLLYPRMFSAHYEKYPRYHKDIFEYLKHSAYRKFKELRKDKRRGRLMKYARQYYKDYLLTEMWKELKKQCLEASNFRCEFCGMKATTAHHVVYPKNYSHDVIDNLVSVCDRCHGLTHGIRTQ